MAPPPPPPDHQILSNPYGGRGPLILAVTWTEAVVALILMGARTYTNGFIVRSFKWDYWWALITLITGLIAQAMVTVSALSGLGNHIYLLWGPQLVKALLWSWIGQISAINAIGFGKIAVIAFLLRIQERNSTFKKAAWFLYFIAISNVVININQSIMILLQCSPSQKLWDLSVPGSCYHVERTNHVGYFQGSWAAASDLALAVYPVLVFWNLKIGTKTKIGLCLLMAGGLVAAAAGAIKTVYIKLITAEEDPTYAISTLVIWAYTENWLVLILGSLPPLRSLFVRVFQQISTSASRSRSRTARNDGYNQTYSQPSRTQKSNNINMYPVLKKTQNTSDDDSERNILPNEGGGFGRGTDAYGAGILRTTEIRQTVGVGDEKDDVSDDSLRGLDGRMV
ncbi:MAG: hypothetical protein Q9174_003244 [Haloplaca sp. 1 TL-2023]